MHHFGMTLGEVGKLTPRQAQSLIEDVSEMLNPKDVTGRARTW